MFGNKQRVVDLTAENATLTAKLEELGAMEHLELERRLSDLRDEMATTSEKLEAERNSLTSEIAAEALRLREVKQEVVETDDAVILQEVGVYQYRHPLDSAAQYKGELDTIKSQLKTMVRNKSAVTAITNFTFNNSAAKGRSFVNDFSKLMLRAYNAEAENCVRVLKAGTLTSAEKRLRKTADVIERFGRMIDMRVTSEYQRLRLRELELTADYLVKLQEEKEAARAERDRLREEEKARAEYRREQERLLKERLHYQNALVALRAKGDLEGASEIEGKIADVDHAIEGIKDREAHIRAGYVYVISNIGAFGEQMVKIGMTRRLNPLDRVTELGDASVPFRYDIHALFFSQDAVGIETSLHQALESKRVNKVNLRREFFYATPAEVRELLLKEAGNLLEFVEEPEAPEFWQSGGVASQSQARTVDRQSRD
ncbi:MAG: DUF4041 domain-containing protein [Actinobacteria bacterium]|nr:DUF4041 domain-containing protein [Actinomycetota bacterium]